MTIRPIRVDDRERWEPLWHGYLDFYRAVLTPEVTERTWAALCDPTSAVHGLVAEQEDHLAGLAHLGLHPTTRATHPTCYLEDLYVATQWRGGDVAHRLIEAASAVPREIVQQAQRRYTTNDVRWAKASYKGACRGVVLLVSQ